MNARYCESLEARRLFATYGNPWPDGSRLTMSFAPDTTALVGQRSQLHSSLDGVLTRAAWQSQIARALQTWAVHTDVNIGYRADSGQRFGVPGFSMGDPRFGDIRIGAHEMTSDVLALSVPYDPARAGTLTGDIFLNSSFRFDGAPYDLNTVMLHEAGHVFGLDHSTNEQSPMFARFNNPISELTPGDIEAIRRLYGNRPADRFDRSGTNDTFANASPIPAPNNFTGATPLAVFGDLTTGGDLDYYKFQTPSDDNGYQGLVTVRLQSSGISLMRPSLRVLDSDGVVVGSSVSSADLGDTISVTFNANGDDTDYFIEIGSAANDVFGIGTYAAAVVFAQRNAVSESAIEAVLTGPHAEASADALRSLFLSGGSALLNTDGGTDNTLGSAAQVDVDWGSPLVRGAELLGSIESGSDVDHYRILLPAGSNDTLTFNLLGSATGSVLPSMTLWTLDGTPVASRMIANGNRVVTLQMDRVVSVSEVVVRVGSPNSGNYYFSVDRVTPRSELTPFSSGSTRTASGWRKDTLYIAESQLMHFLLTAAPDADPLAVLIMRIIDVSSGRMAYELRAPQGQSVSGASALLPTGEYRVEYFRSQLSSSRTDGSRERPSLETSKRAMQFSLQGSSLSGPIGPSLRDPLLRPRYLHPTIQDARLYPNGRVTRDTFLWEQIVV